MVQYKRLYSLRLSLFRGSPVAIANHVDTIKTSPHMLRHMRIRMGRLGSSAIASWSCSSPMEKLHILLELWTRHL